MSDYVFFFIFLQLLLIVPSFYCCRFLIKKAGIIHVKTLSFICTIGFAVLFTLAFIKINSKYIYPYIRSEKFDSYKWKTKSEKRYKMVNYIIEQKVLIGKNREDVIVLLGDNFEKGPCENCIGYSTNEPDEGFSIDHEVLQIEFDKENKVIDVGLNDW